MTEFEKIEYKPVSVRELLTEMKDTSELMIDLAYSAALFHSKELAEEVLELESYIDTLVYLLNMNAMLAARDAEDAEADEVIREGDILIARGAPAGIEEFEEAAEGKIEKLEEE